MINRLIVILFLLQVMIFRLPGQDIAQLQAEKKKIEDNIHKSSELLKKYSQQKSKALTNIRLLNSQIQSRQKLIDIYTTEIEWLNTDINDLKSDINKAEDELIELKGSYARLIQKSFKNRCVYNEISFFLGAESFNKAYRRFIMYKDYNKFRRNQGELIQQRSLELHEKKDILETKLKVQTNAYKRVVNEKSHLLSNKHNLNISVQSLKQKERMLKKQIRDNQKALQKLEKAILRLIEEISSETYAVSGFDKAIGKLSWPVSQGLVISKFGEHQHPVLKYVKVNNNGVDIQCENSNTCKVVYDGVVSKVVPIPGYNKTVIVRHGKFLTVYANLQTVTVKKGDKLMRGGDLGVIYSGDGENSNVLHFEIWEENKKLDPEKWLYH